MKIQVRKEKTENGLGKKKKNSVMCMLHSSQDQL